MRTHGRPRSALRGIGAASLILALNLTACGSSGPAQPTTNEQSQPTVPGARHVEVEATNFAFSPNVITAAPGEALTIVLRSTVGRHDLVVYTDGERATRIALADEGEWVYGGLTAPTAPGTYKIICSMLGHLGEGMVGQLVVA